MKKTATASIPPRKYRIASTEFLVIAKTISESAIALPAIVLQLARRAAAAHKRFAKWFAGRAEHEFSNQTHDYFISVIESDCEILESGEAPPAYNPRRFGQADPRVDHSTMNARERFNEDRRIILEELTNIA